MRAWDGVEGAARAGVRGTATSFIPEQQRSICTSCNCIATDVRRISCFANFPNAEVISQALHSRKEANDGKQSVECLAC